MFSFINLSNNNLLIKIKSEYSILCIYYITILLKFIKFKKIFII